MTMNWKNFFFVAMDSAGLVLVDKLPSGQWIQVVRAKIFGFHGWSIILPHCFLHCHVTKYKGSHLFCISCLGNHDSFSYICRNYQWFNFFIWMKKFLGKLWSASSYIHLTSSLSTYSRSFVSWHRICIDNRNLNRLII